MELIDISPTVHPGIGVWPGDVPYQAAKALRMADGANLDLGSLHSTYHVGAHADAPQHYVEGGADAASVPLAPYVGPCQVVDVAANRGQRFGRDDLKEAPASPRILFKTGTFGDPDDWNTDFAAPEPELIDELAALGVVLVGFDTPSTDLFDDEALLSHHRLAAHQMANLEGLVLEHVPAGHYTLLALPLKLADADASPVRAVLAPADAFGAV
ncbi:MAG: cyclase family protein [Thermoplasmatota archaeon]